MNFYEFYNILNEYGENLVQSLIQKFKKENPTLTPTIIRNYVNRFENIKNNLPEKDITKYSWKELENTVDGYQSSTRIKTGKLDPTVSDANLLFNKNNIRIYLGKDKKSCIKYSNGYSFCIGSRGENNMYQNYRIANKGTPYFIFNDNLPKENPSHILVLFVYKRTDSRSRYTITNALNRGDNKYNSLDEIIALYPWMENIKSFVGDDKGDVEIEPLEKIEHYLQEELNNEKEAFEYTAEDSFKDSSLLENSFFNDLKHFISNSNYNLNSDIAKIVMFFPGYGWYDDKKDEFLVFYTNENDILKAIKNKTKDITYEDFKYKESDDEIKQKISKALKSKPVNPQDEIDEYIGDKAIKGGYGFTVVSKESLRISNDYDIFYVKVTNPKEYINKFIDINKDKINKLNNTKISYNKAINYIKTQSIEKLQSIVSYYENKMDLEKTKRGVDYLPSMIDVVSRFMEE